MNDTNPKIPENIKRRFPEIVELILSARSMSEDERKYWIQLLPIMSDEQIAELKHILTEEKKSISEIDAKYAEQKAMLDEVSASISKQERLSQKIKQLREQEAQHEEQESIEQEKILNELNE